MDSAQKPEPLSYAAPRRVDKGRIKRWALVIVGELFLTSIFGVFGMGVVINAQLEDAFAYMDTPRPPTAPIGGDPVKIYTGYVIAMAGIPLAIWLWVWFFKKENARSRKCGGESPHAD